VKLDTFTEVLWAATITHRVRSRFPSRGGIFLVSPPGQLKTSLLSIFESQVDAVCYSDMTSTTLVEARDLIASNKVNTLILLDFQKLYERRADTASNIEGNIRGLMDEGFTTASFERVSHNVIQSKARALVMGALTPAFYRAKLSGWESSGFARRSIFCVYKLSNPGLIEQAILRENPIELKCGPLSMPVNLEIPALDLTTKEEAFLTRLLHKQREDVPLNLLKKIFAVLRWRYTKHLKQKDRSLEVLEEFGECLGHGGAEISL
jgi:hypothetical protein